MEAIYVMNNLAIMLFGLFMVTTAGLWLWRVMAVVRRRHRIERNLRRSLHEAWLSGGSSATYSKPSLSDELRFSGWPFHSEHQAHDDPSSETVSPKPIVPGVAKKRKAA